MPTMQEVRAKFPQYNDMSDGQLADALHGKFYSDMPRQEFNTKIGFDPAKTEAMQKRDDYYSGGIYAGDWNPLGPIARTVDAFASGAQRAPLLGWDDEAAAALNTAGGLAGDYEQAREGVDARKNAQRAQNPIASATGELAGAIAAAGAGTSFAGRAIQSGRSLPWVVAGSAADGLALGAVQGAGDASPGDRLGNAGYGAVGGLAVGAAIPVATRAIGSATRSVVSPFLTNPERTAAVQALAREGVETTAGQRTGNDALRYAESELGGGRARSIMDEQGEQFTSAALRRAGIDARRATTDVMDDAFTRIGNEFDGLASRNTLQPDHQLAVDLGTTAREYMALVPESQRAPVVMDTIRDLGRTLTQGPLDGAAYQATRSRLDRYARGAARDPQLQQALYGIRNSIDDAMERSITATNPADVGAWQQARRQYRNMLTLEQAATGAGENAAQGLISPQALRSATVGKQGRRNYARGDGDFAELARSGAAVMQPMPNSGTAGRLNAQNLGAGLGALFGGGAGYASGGDPASMAAGAAAGYALPKIAGRALMSEAAQAYLGNQVGRNLQMSPAARRIFNQIMNIRAAEENPSVGRALVGGGW